MNPGPTFDRVYAEIRRRLLCGGWLPGQHIDLAILADSLDASITPVRDALYRLVGEGMLMLGVSDGFAAPPITEPELRDRYEWSQMLLELCLRKPPKQILRSRPAESEAPDGSVVCLWEQIAALAGNTERSAAVTMLNDRLSTARIAEAELGLETHEEIFALWQRGSHGDARLLRSAVARYHRARIRNAGRIVYAMHRPG